MTKTQSIHFLDSNNEIEFIKKFDDAKIFNLLNNKTFIDKDLLKINKLIQNYNLIAPSMDRHFMPLQKTNELQRAKNSVLADFPSSKFLIKAKKKYEIKIEKLEKQSQSNGFLKNLLNRYC